MKKKETSNESKLGDGSFVRRIPGFRSGTVWKMVSSSIVYVFALIIILALASSAFASHTPSFEVAGAPISIVNNNSTTENGMMINATLRDTGSNISLLPVEVYSGGNRMGIFFLNNVTSDQDVWFKFNATNNSNINIQTSNGDTVFYQDMYGDQNNESSDNNSDDSNSYSLNPGDYKFVIGNQSADINDNMLNGLLTPLINSYNNTKGAQTDNIKIQGQVKEIKGPFTGDLLDLTIFPDNNLNETAYPMNTNLTLIVPMDTGSINQGDRQYQDSGDIVSAYQNYLDVMVVYWPDMKVAGWHRIMGTAVPDNGYSGGGDIYGDNVNDSDVNSWINSLPKA